MHEKTRNAEAELLDTLDALGWDVDEITVREDGERRHTPGGDSDRVVAAVEVELSARKSLTDE